MQDPENDFQAEQFAPKGHGTLDVDAVEGDLGPRNLESRRHRAIVVDRGPVQRIADAGSEVISWQDAGDGRAVHDP